MIPGGAMLDRIQSMIDDKSTETRIDIINSMNAAICSISSEHIWSTLTVQVTNPGTVLPADCIRVVYVEDGTDQLYFKIGIPSRYASDRLYNYFENMTVTTPLLVGSDLVTSINSKTVTSVTGGFTTALHVGEYISIGENLGLYKIASVTDTNTLVLEEGFRGADVSDPDIPADLTAQYFEIRPEGTKQFLQTDESGDAITSATTKLWYLRKPLPIYNDYDRILLPGNCEAVFIYTCRLMLQSDKYENDSLKRVQDYDRELEKMKSLDPVPQRFVAPRDRMGNRVSFGRRRSCNASSIHSRSY